MDQHPRISEEKRSNFIKNLRIWVGKLSRATRATFDSRFGIRCLWSLYRVKSDENLIRAAAKFWDHEHHVFNFSYNEIVPTYEDFTALCGAVVTHRVAMPQFQVPPELRISRLLRVSVEDARDLLLDGDVDICGLPLRFMNGAVESDAALDCLALCLFASILFPPYVGVATMDCLDMVDQARAERSIIPCLLGETLHGIGELAAGADKMTRGSTRLLTLWLQERLRVLEDPVDPVSPWVCQGRRVREAFVGRTRSAWVTYLAQLGTAQIKWLVPHWRIIRARWTQNNLCFIRVPAFDETSYYYAVRVCRQYGMPQVIPSLWEDTHNRIHVRILPMNVGVAVLLEECWSSDHMPSTLCIQRPRDVLLSREYLGWYQDTLGNIRQTLRRLRRRVVVPYVSSRRLREDENIQREVENELAQLTPNERKREREGPRGVTQFQKNFFEDPTRRARRGRRDKKPRREEDEEEEK